MTGGYLTKLEERVDGQYEIITFVGGHSWLRVPKKTTLFYHIVESIPELEEERAREVLNIERVEDDYHINHEARTVDYNGGTYPLDPETITLTNYEEEVRLR